MALRCSKKKKFKRIFESGEQPTKYVHNNDDDDFNLRIKIAMFFLYLDSS